MNDLASEFMQAFKGTWACSFERGGEHLFFTSTGDGNFTYDFDEASSVLNLLNLQGPDAYTDWCQNAVPIKGVY